VHTLEIAPLRSESPPQKRSGMARISQFYLHTHTFIRNRNEPYLPLPSQLQLVLIYGPRRDGKLSRGPWCEIAQAEIRTCNLPIANPALYHTATSAPVCATVLQVRVYCVCRTAPRHTCAITMFPRTCSGTFSAGMTTPGQGQCKDHALSVTSRHT